MILADEIKKLVYERKTLQEVLETFPNEEEAEVKRLYQKYRAQYRSDCAEALTHPIDTGSSEQTCLESETNFFS